MELAKRSPVSDKILMNLTWGCLQPLLPVTRPFCIACSAPLFRLLFKPLVPQLLLFFIIFFFLFFSAVIWGY